MTEWYPWYPALYRADTMHLTAEQDGIYRRLIDHYMETRQPLPDNDAALARIASVSSDSWTMAATIIRPFFKPTREGFLRHKRCEIELDRQDGKMRSYTERGKKGAEKRWGHNKQKQDDNNNSHNLAIAQPMLTDGRGEEKRGQKKKEDVSDHVFSGHVIRLNRRDYDHLCKTFHTIPDMQAELTAIDAKFSDNTPAQWFQTLTGWLKKKHETNLAAAKIPKQKWTPMPSVAGG